MASSQTGLQAPDLACFGIRVAPMGGVPETIVTPVVPFGAPPSVTVPGLPVRFFTGGQASPGCTEPDCLAAVADGSGNVAVSLPLGAWVTTEVPAIDGPDPMRSFMRTLEQQWRVGDEETINTFNRGTLMGFEGALGAAVDPTRGLVAGRVLDCAGRPLAEARLRYFDGAGVEVFADARTLYFDGAFPPGLDLSAESTATDGRYAGIDLPTQTQRIEAWGSVGDAPPTRIACEVVQVEADTLTIQVLSPLRADAPDVCGG